MPFASTILAYRYAIVFPLAVVEGPLVTLVCGFLARLGYFDLVLLYAVIVAGEFAADLLWYVVGRYAAWPFTGRFSGFFHIAEPDVDRLVALFQRQHTAAIFLSKVTMGFGFALATLTAAGKARVPLGTYAGLNLLGGLIWTAALLFGGYLVGSGYLALPTALHGVFAVLFASAAVAAAYGFRRYMRTHVGTTLIR